MTIYITISVTLKGGQSFLECSPSCDLAALFSAVKRSSYLELRWSSSGRYLTTVANPLDTKASATFLKNKSSSFTQYFVPKNRCYTYNKSCFRNCELMDVIRM